MSAKQFMRGNSDSKRLMRAKVNDTAHILRR